MRGKKLTAPLSPAPMKVHVRIMSPLLAMTTRDTAARIMMIKNLVRAVSFLNLFFNNPLYIMVEVAYRAPDVVPTRVRRSIPSNDPAKNGGIFRSMNVGRAEDERVSG